MKTTQQRKTAGFAMSILFDRWLKDLTAALEVMTASEKAKLRQVVLKGTRPGRR